MNDFRTFAPFTKVAKQPDGTIKCHSVVHDETVDDQGEIIDYQGGRAAIDDFMKWANVREMHGEIAVGTVETVVHDDVAQVSEAVLHVVDPVAVQKVETGVYKGTSWGGLKGAERALEKVAGHTATRLLKPTFIELSLVDRPSRPTAVLTMLKRADVPPVTEGDAMSTPATKKAPAVPRENIAPVVEPAAAPAGEPLAKAAADDLLDTHMLEESLARMIETEAGEEAPNSGRIEKYKAALALLQEADAIAADELGTTADTTEAATEEAEEDAEFADMIAASAPTTTVVLAAAAKTGDLRKVGARNAAQDQADLNQILALALKLGAQMPPEETADDGTAAPATPPAPAAAAPIAKVAGVSPDTFVDGIMDRLAESAVFAKAADVAAMKGDLLEALGPIKEELAKIAAQPAPGGPVRYATDARGIYGPTPASPREAAIENVLSKVSDPRLREELGHAIAVEEIAAAGR